MQPISTKPVINQVSADLEDYSQTSTHFHKHAMCIFVDVT